MEPTFLLWTPRPFQKSADDLVIRFNVTPYSVQHWPQGDDEGFYRQLLADLEVEAAPVGSDALPYRSRYHSDWDDPAWRNNWRVSIDLSGYGGEVPEFQQVYETTAHPEAEGLPAAEEVNALVIADFKVRDWAQDALKEIGDRLAEWEDELFEVPAVGWQLQIDLGPRPRAYYEDTKSDEVHQLEEICRKHHGWSTYEEQLNAYGE